MATETIYQQGSNEPFDETIRGYFARLWSAANSLKMTPAFVSPNGSGKGEADYTEDLTKNDMEALQVEGLIKFEAIEQRLAHSGAGQSGKTFATRIDITLYATNRWIMFHFMKEMNRIISDNRPNTGLRIKKTDNQNDSAVAYFEEPQITFARPAKIDDSTHLVVTTGFLNVRWMINET